MQRLFCIYWSYKPKQNIICRHFSQRDNYILIVITLIQDKKHDQRFD